MKNKLKSILLMGVVACGMFLGCVNKASAMDKISPVRATVTASGLVGGGVVIAAMSCFCVLYDDSGDYCKGVESLKKMK